jgi:modulator of FtsH protease HflK
MKRFIILALVVLFLLTSAMTAVTQIQPGERGVVRRFGRIVDTPGPGLYVGLPWGMDRVDRERIDRVRRITVGFDARGPEDEFSGRTPDGQLLTGDHNLVDLQVEINYTVNDEEVAKYVLQADRADALLARCAEAAMAEWNAGRTVDDVLLRGKRPDTLPAWLVNELNRRIQPYELGVTIEKVDVTLLNPPADVKNAFDEVARANTEIKTRINQALQEADRREREADSKRFNMERNAAAYKQEQYLQARADAGNFLKRLDQYRQLQKQNPFYLAGIWWDEMSRLFASMRQNGRLDLLDNHLGADGLDITEMPLLPKKR